LNFRRRRKIIFFGLFAFACFIFFYVLAFLGNKYLVAVSYFFMSLFSIFAHKILIRLYGKDKKEVPTLMLDKLW